MEILESCGEMLEGLYEAGILDFLPGCAAWTAYAWDGKQGTELIHIAGARYSPSFQFTIGESSWMLFDELASADHYDSCSESPPAVD